MKNNFMARCCYPVDFWMGFLRFLDGVSYEQQEEFQISLSLRVQFSEPFAKVVFFLSNLQL